MLTCFYSLGPVSLAAQSVLLVSASTTFQAPFALSVAAAVRIGNLLGEANGKRAAIATRTSLLMGLAMALVWWYVNPRIFITHYTQHASSTMYITFRNSWARIFNDDPAVGTLVASVLPIVGLFQVFDCLAAVSGGILRAQGKQASRSFDIPYDCI